MEHDAVVEVLADQLLDVLDVARREIRAHLDHDRALGRLEGESVASFGHENSCDG